MKFLSWFVKIVFVFLFLAFVFFSLLEEIQAGFVSNYLNLHWLLIALLISSIFLLLFGNGGISGSETISKHKSRLLIFFSMVVVWFLVWFGAKDFFWSWRLLLSFYAALLVWGILAVLSDD